MPGLTVNRKIRKKKDELLDYYRHRASELVTEVKRQLAETEFKQRANEVNKGLTETKNTLIKIIEQKSKNENWSSEETLEGILLVTYTNYIVMMEARNDVWKYEYMSFARRIGELWEPFCQLCWQYPINKNINFFVPPLFKDVRQKLAKEIDDFIKNLKISSTEKRDLKRYYDKVWTLVTSGEIQLELDLHFEIKKIKYVVDFKSGFSSNEKGNTNRLLLVASIYRILEENYNCLIFVRSEEEANNHYLQTLKKSKIWTVFCGRAAYNEMEKFTGFNLAKWLKNNINWAKDFEQSFYKELKSQDLLRYLEW